jgi:hypothetical protein
VRIKGNVTAVDFRRAKDREQYPLIRDAVIGIYLNQLNFGNGDYSTREMPTLRYIRFVGNGGIKQNGQAFAACQKLLSISCERALSLPNYTQMFLNDSALLAVSNNIFKNTNAIASNWTFCASSAPQVNAKIKSNNAAYCFYNSKIAFFDGEKFDTSTASALNNMFHNAGSLCSVENLNISKMTNCSNMFVACYGLQYITFAGETTPGGYTIDLQYATLGHDALVEMIASLPTATNAATITITNNPGAAELTEDEIAVATAKNWTITI